MTVICALHQEGQIWIGSDTLSTTANDVKLPGGAPKWTWAHGWALGDCGDARVGDIVEEAADRLFRDLDRPFALVERLREILPDYGQKIEAREPAQSPLCAAEFLLAHARGVWHIGYCLSICAIPAGVLWAKGSGGEAARGAGHATDGLLPPDLRVRRAIEAAIALDAGCGGKVWVRQLDELMP